MSGSIKADLRLEADSTGLQASLELQLNASAQEWTRASIIGHLRGQGIAAGIDARAIEKAMERLSTRKDGAQAAVVARGTPPAPGVAAEVRWEVREIPPELLPHAERILSGGRPRVFSRRIEKKKIEETLRKPALLPFLPVKEERVATWKKKVVTAEVAVDPSVLTRGFVRAGETLATVTRSQRGRPGRDVFGQPIPAEEPEPREICLGGPLKERGEAVLAEADGFFRGGKGWIELLPFTPSASRVYHGRDGTTCLLDYTPGSDGSPPPDPDGLLLEAGQQGFPRDTLLPRGEIEQVLREAWEKGTILRAARSACGGTPRSAWRSPGTGWPPGSPCSRGGGWARP